jgi:hypothetical protein
LQGFVEPKILNFEVIYVFPDNGSSSSDLKTALPKCLRAPEGSIGDLHIAFERYEENINFLLSLLSQNCITANFLQEN